MRKKLHSRVGFMPHLFLTLFVFFSLFTLHCDELKLPPSIKLEVPMRDGTTLAGDLYLPHPEAKNLPCLLVRSPAGRQSPYALLPLALLKEGYAVFIQETRSAKDVEGKTIPYLADGWGEHQDGYDTVTWLANSPYTNGKIGTVGQSAMGITQLFLGPTHPEGLVAQHVTFATSDVYHQGLYHNGEMLKNQVEGWLSYYAKHPDVYNTVLTQPEYNAFWTKFNIAPVVSKTKTPAIHVGGWYDTFLKGALDGFVAIQNNGGEGAKGKQKLVVGPWTHLWPLVTTFGDFQYPEAALKPPYDFSPEKWFAYTLKGEQNGIEKNPTVLYYVMGPFDGSPSKGNVWKTADTWPIPYVEKKFYLTQDNSLSDSREGHPYKKTYSYDPENPSPTLGGRNLFYHSGPVDQRPLENRADSLVFTSHPFDKDVEFTGNMEAVLYVDTDKEDTDFTVRLTDVYPDGRSILIGDGAARLSTFRKENSKKPTQVKVDLWPTSIVIAKGHCLRVIVSSSNYPRYEKNLNTLKRVYEKPNTQIANNTLYWGQDYPSHIALPLVK